MTARIVVAIGDREVASGAAIMTFGSASGELLVDDATFTNTQATLRDRDGQLVLMGHTWAPMLAVRFRGSTLSGHETVVVVPGDVFALGHAPELAITIRAHAPMIARDFESTEAAFLAGLRTDPDDDALRSVYADALEQRGELQRAEWLREELAMRAGGHGGRLDALKASLAGAPRWWRSVGRARIEIAPILAQRTDEVMRARTWPPAGTTFPVPRRPCERSGCPRTWSTLPEREDERVNALHPYRRLVRTCGTCGTGVPLIESIEELYEEGYESGDPVVAIDRIAASRMRRP